ncbi:hypothetical protein PFLUV_G00029070 [Perca fluviatilis]|uniref:Uncharacterized protein n=1 Tax=Perca fluviatilis TaxID=8168 RepID=A0A6A5FJS0_PERFL|nr:hypothetical protein PFLUV_G00029070 [Perca fluviatilis]
MKGTPFKSAVCAQFEEAKSRSVFDGGTRGGLFLVPRVRGTSLVFLKEPQLLQRPSTHHAHTTPGDGSTDQTKVGAAG